VSDSFLWQVAATIVVIALAPFGILLEPTPISEAVAVTILASIWGLPLLDDGDGGEA